MRDLWVDFNEVEDDQVTTLLAFAENAAAVQQGRVVIVGDDDGTTCEGEVVAVTGEFVRLHLRRGTLSHASVASPAASAIA